MTQPAASDIRVGAILRDTYEITSLLGKGGMGTVFLARHRRLPGKQVAVKVLHNSASLNPELYARFRREAEIASQLGHPNIVQVLDFDTLQDGAPFLVMEYLRGESLEQRLTHGPLPIHEALSITRQICSALQAAHRAGVVHRDLKPANVFLVPTDSGGVVAEQVKLLDFGISKMLDSQTLQTQETVLIGTPQYMAPEQALGKNSEVDARTDIFALGCIVYELLSGSPPFAGDGGSLVQVIFRIVHGQPEPLASLCPGLPSEVLRAVEKALAKSPQERYPDVGSFIAELTGSPLQSLAGVAIPTFSSSRAAASVPSRAADEGGFAATHMPASTARFPAPAAAAPDDGGFAATHMPASTARFPAPAAVADELGLAATHVPSSMAGIPAPVAQPAPVSPAPVVPAPAVAPVPEAVQVTAPQAVPARSKPGMGVVAGAGMLVLALVALGGWFATRSAPGPASGAPVPVAVPTPVPVAVPTPVPAPEVPEPPAVPEPIVAAPAPTALEPKAPVATASKPSTRPSASEAMPEEVRVLLDQAESALNGGDVEEAIRLARTSQRVKLTPASFSVLTRAYCSRMDLSGAKAAWRQGMQKMSRPERTRVVAFCDKHNIEL
jgi:serine/threonine-protein kinase